MKPKWCIHVLRQDGTMERREARDDLRSAATEFHLTAWERGQASGVTAWTARRRFGNGAAKAHLTREACPRGWSQESPDGLHAFLAGLPLPAPREVLY